MRLVSANIITRPDSKTSLVFWHAPIIPAGQEAEVEGSVSKTSLNKTASPCVKSERARDVVLLESGRVPA